MKNIYKSATIKLTAWYLVIVMAVSVLVSIVVYNSARHEIIQGLQAQASRIYQKYPVFSGNPFFVKHSDVSHDSHNLILNLLYFNIAVLVVAGFASYFLARQTLRPIEASNERQKRFVADASHELRTPLTSLKMGSEVALMDESLSKLELQEALKSNLEETNKLEGLLNNLLRLSQLESEEIRSKFTSLNLGIIIDSSISHVNDQAKAKQITIDNQTNNTPIIGDRDSLIQLLVILLDNAIKYSHPGSQVTIKSNRQEHFTVVTVKDQGIGIEPLALEHVFDRFYRADRARSGSQGFGLGLAIAKNIADLHNGSISLTSTLGKGTESKVILPNDPTKTGRLIKSH